MPIRLPQPDALRVDREKIVDYLLNPDHKDGASKAKFFTAFGFATDAWEVMAESLRQHGRRRDIVGEKSSGFGVKYELQCDLITPDGRNPCIWSIWIIETDEPPRLVTAYPAP